MNRLTNLNTVIDVQLTEEVETQISNLVDKYRSQSEIILGELHYISSYRRHFEKE